MKVAKQILCVVLFYFLSVSVSSASPQLTLGASTGVSGQYVMVYGTGFWPNTSGFVFFDHNYDYQMTTGANWKCGYLSDKDCEPAVSVYSDANGNFTTSLLIPPGKKVDFLGAGTYFIGANLPIGGGSDASAPFKVLAEFAEGKPSIFALTRVPTVTGSNFAPFRLDGTPSQGRVWWDVDSDFGYYFDPNEPGVTVWVLPDGTLSACQASSCKVPNPFLGRGVKAHIRVDIGHEADTNRSVEQKVEASFVMMCPPLGGC